MISQALLALDSVTREEHEIEQSIQAGRPRRPRSLQCHSVQPASHSVSFRNTQLYQPPRTGNQNSLVEMYTNITSWSASVTPNLTPSCNYSVANFSRGTTLRF